MDYASLSPEKTLEELASSETGLGMDEVRARQKSFGPNQLSDTAKTSLILRIIEPFKSLFVIVLLVAAGISVASGEVLDAVVMTIVLMINACIYYVQQASAGRVLAKLKASDERRITTLRGGGSHPVPPHDLVPGDIVLLSEGAKIPADGRLIETRTLSIDESILTGESEPTKKHTSSLQAGSALHERANMVYSGTLVRSGTGVYVVTAIANETELGRIAQLSESKPEPSPLQRKIDQLATRVVIAIGIMLVFIFMLALYRGMPTAEALRFLLSLAVAAVPEGLPVALTLVLLFSVQRMAKKHALVRRLSAVETLGAVELIATDKTGTITKNELELVKFVPYGEDETVLRRHLRRAVVIDHGHTDDPLEELIAKSISLDEAGDGAVAHTLPFDQAARMSGALWTHGRIKELYVKGAPEHVIAACDVSPAERRRLHAELEELSAQGYRVIASAFKKTSLTEPTLTGLHGFQFSGFVALADGMRRSVPAAVRAAHAAGVKVIMLTGDNPATATTIARKAGIISEHEHAITGSEIAELTPEQIREKVETQHAFARVLPEHKYAILSAYHGKLTTSMTGDGVNDVPALVKADVGIAVGRGSDAAKEASDIILLNNNFATIVDAIRSGRAILANVRKMLMYLFTTTMAEVAIMTIALIVAIPLPMTAIQILWVNIIADGFAVIPLGLERAETNQMKQPPAPRDAPLLSRRQIIRVLLGAGGMSILVLWTFLTYRAINAELAQTMAFLVLVVAQWGNALVIRSEHTSLHQAILKPNWILIGSLTVAAIIQTIIVVTPARSILEMNPIGVMEGGVILGAFVLTILGAEIIRRVTVRRIA